MIRMVLKQVLKYLSKVYVISSVSKLGVYIVCWNVIAYKHCIFTSEVDYSCILYIGLLLFLMAFIIYFVYIKTVFHMIIGEKLLLGKPKIASYERNIILLFVEIFFLINCHSQYDHS